MHRHDLTSQDEVDYGAIAAAHHLPWERGVRAHYVTRENLVVVVADLQAAGFVVALDLDAAGWLK